MARDAAASDDGSEPLFCALALVATLQSDLLGPRLSQTDLAALRLTCRTGKKVVDGILRRRHAFARAALLGGDVPAHLAADAPLPKFIIGADVHDRRWEVLLSLLPSSDLAGDATLLRLVGRLPAPTARRRDRRTASVPTSAFLRLVGRLEDLSPAKRAALIVATRVVRHGASYEDVRPLLLAVNLAKDTGRSTAMYDVGGRACIGSVIDGQVHFAPLPRPRNMAERAQYPARLWELQVLHFNPLHGEALLCYLLLHGHDVPPRLLTAALAFGPHVELLLPYAEAGHRRRHARFIARRAALERQGGLTDDEIATRLRAEKLVRDPPAVDSVRTHAAAMLTQWQLSAGRLRAHGLLGGQTCFMEQTLEKAAESRNVVTMMRVLRVLKRHSSAPAPVPLLPEAMVSNLALPLCAVGGPADVERAAALAVNHPAAPTVVDLGWVVRRLTASTRLRGTPPPLSAILRAAARHDVGVSRWVTACLQAWPAAVPALLNAGATANLTKAGPDLLRSAAMETLLAATDPSGPPFVVPPALQLERLEAQLPWLGPLLAAPRTARVRVGMAVGSPVLLALLAAPPRENAVRWLVDQGAPVPANAVELGADLLLPLVAKRAGGFAGGMMDAAAPAEAAAFNAHVLSTLSVDALRKYIDAVAAAAGRTAAKDGLCGPQRRRCSEALADSSEPAAKRAALA